MFPGSAFTNPKTKFRRIIQQNVNKYTKCWNLLCVTEPFFYGFRLSKNSERSSLSLKTLSLIINTLKNKNKEKTT